MKNEVRNDELIKEYKRLREKKIIQLIITKINEKLSKDIRNLNKINSFELSNFEENIFIFFPNRNDKYKFIIKGVYKIYFS